MAKTIMVQGTGSHVGKSVLVAALCRIFYQDGYRVAPFKSQNMALNSYVTRDGGEMGRAQVVQAEAAGIEPRVEMNPILLKPTGHTSSQVVVLGRPLGNMAAQEYHLNYTQNALGMIEDCLNKLGAEFDIICIEGAGSPVEINLKPRDIVNMRIAKMAKAPVLLVVDIDKGGALASIVGTLELLDPDERELVQGIVINKFRGDIALLRPALDFLEERTGKPVVGVVPYFQGFRVQEEDSLAEEQQMARTAQGGDIDVAVIRLPHISNFTDFDSLEDEPDVNLRYIGRGDVIGSPDLLIIPGTKNTIDDMVYLTNSGYASRIRELSVSGLPVIGICGGFQMLGRIIRDPLHTEGSVEEVSGLGLIDMETVFDPDKITNQAEGEVYGSGTFLDQVRGEKVTGYEIHMGRTDLGRGVEPAFRITSRSGSPVDILDGAVGSRGLVFGTYLHGIFDNDQFRRHLLNKVRAFKGLKPLEGKSGPATWEQRNQDYNRLADVVRSALDMKKIREILGLPAGRE